MEVGNDVVPISIRVPYGAFTQSILRGVIRRRLSYLINKKWCFHYNNDHLHGVFCPSVNATSGRASNGGESFETYLDQMLPL